MGPTQAHVSKSHSGVRLVHQSQPKVKSMPAQYRKIGLRLPAALLVSAAIATAQGPQVAPPPTQPADGNRSAAMFPPLPNTALGQKAALMGSLAPKWNKVPDLEGTGPFPASYAAAPNGSDYVLYQPKDLAGAEAKGKLGVYVWGSGGCSPDAAGSRFHLTEIASHGYVVIVPGKILSGPKAPPRPEGAEQGPNMQDPTARATAEKMVAGIDWILAENQRQGSPYFGAIDPARIAVAGFSCGGLIALKAGFDPRVSAVLIESSGILRNPPPATVAGLPQMTSLKKEDLDKLHTPVLYLLGGPEDIAESNGLDDFEHVNKVPIFLGDQPGAGHGGLISVPNAEGTKIELDWLDWQFNHDPIAAETFTGPHCELCRDFRWQVHRKAIE
jgi:hypothetical protein